MSTHNLTTIAQEVQCTRCWRRWDLDEQPDAEEECDAVLAAVKKRPSGRQSRYTRRCKSV